MNKPVKLILILSIAVNAIWVFGAASGWLSFGKAGGKVSGDVAQKTDALSPEAAKEMAALFAADDAAKLRDELRALGVPEDVVRAVVSVRIRSRSAARYREISEAARQAEAQRPYWSAKPRRALIALTADQWGEIIALQREENKQIKQIMGTGDEVSGYAHLRYTFLPSEKVGRLSEIESDYYQLRAKVAEEMSGFRMPGDDAKLKLLDEEYKRDVAAVLTPDEKMAKDLRDSSTAYDVRRAFAGFDGTEEEYKTIFALQQKMEEKFPSDTPMAAMMYGGADVSEYWRAYSEAQKQVDAQIKEALGDARYAEYVRGQRQDYQTLMAAADRFNLGADIVAQTYQARDNAANEAKRISDDKRLNAGQKKEAYAALAEQATAQIRAALGDEVGDAYINNALVWLKNLPRGGNVTIDKRGNVNVSQPKK